MSTQSQYKYQAHHVQDMGFTGYKEEPIPNAETIEAIKESIAFDEGKIGGKVYSSVDEMFDDILGEDDDDL